MSLFYMNNIYSFTANPAKAARVYFDFSKIISGLALVIIFVFTMNSGYGQIKQKNDLDDMNLAGNIKSVKETISGVNQEILLSFGDVQPSVLSATLEYLFNTQGNITTSTSYYANGDINRICLYKFDNLDRDIQCNCYNKKNILTESNVFVYDSAGNLHKEKRNNGEGNLVNQIIRHYDIRGNCIEKMFYNPEGKLVDKYTRIYNDMGLLTESCKYNKKGKELVRITYRYDSYRNVVGEVSLVCSPKVGLISRIVYLYTYDNHGNWIQKLLITWIYQILQIRTIYQPKFQKE